MSQCGWLEMARKFPFSHKIIRQPKRCSELARVFENMCWKFKWEAVSDLWTPYSWRKSCRWKRGSIFLPPIPPSVSSSAATSGDFPCFNFSLHMQKIQANRIPIPFPTLSPGPPAADQFWGKKLGVNGKSVNLQTSLQRGQCAYLSPNTMVKKSLALIVFGIYSNDLPRRVLRCQGFSISNISPNKIFVKIG